MDSDVDKFDGILLTVLQQGSGIGNFFDSVFGFLHRKTNFFEEPQGANKYVDDSFKKWLKKYQDKMEREAKKKRRLEEEERARAKPAEQSSARVKEITPEEYEKRKKLEREAENKPVEPVSESQPMVVETEPVITSSSSSASPSVGKNEEKEEDKLAEGKVRPTKDRGGETDKYTWAQNDIKEITITIPVHPQLRAKDLIIKAEAKYLYVGLKGQPPIIEGELHQLIKPDTFVWVLEEVRTGKVINISFEKYDTQKWWECIIKGDVCVDSSKIQPEPSKISDIEDIETRSQLERMMFDTRQKAMGLPTSDILEKNPQIEDFIRNHPEMDFSKAKFG